MNLDLKYISLSNSFLGGELKVGLIWFVIACLVVFNLLILVKFMWNKWWICWFSHELQNDVQLKFW